MRAPSKALVCVALFVSFVTIASAQVATGTYPLGTYDSLGADVINVGNLNVMLDIPVLHKNGRAGTNFTYDLFYNGSIWTPTTTTGGTWSPDANWGWVVDTQPISGYISEYSYSSGSCAGNHRSSMSVLSQVDYHDRFGTQHQFRGERTENTCTGATTDTLTNTWSQDHQFYYSSQGITDAWGILIHAPVGVSYGAAMYTDTNGNEISTDGNGNFTDTTGNVVLTISGVAPSNKVFTYKDSTGTPRTVQISYTTYAIATNFGCSGTTEYTNPSVPLIASITLADGSAYSFTYEHAAGTANGSVTGRLASVQLPAGGIITYTYPGANGGISCSDGSATGLTRTQTSTSATPSRTYTRTSAGSMLSHTSATDETGNDTEYDFVQYIGSEALANAYYETSRTVHTGTASGPVLLARQSCYNSASPPCNTQSLTAAITRLDTYQTLDGISTAGTTITYDAFLNPILVNTYDYATAPNRGPSLQSELLTYTAIEKIASDQLSDAGGVERKTTYSYDGAQLQSTTGVPQHVSVSGVRGNLTEIDQYISPGADSQARRIDFASQNFQYYDTGSLYTYQGTAGGTTYYAYETTNTYPTTITPASPNGVSLATSATYDPYMGMLATTTLASGAVVSVVSSDVFGRPTAIDAQIAGNAIARLTSTLTPTQSTTTLYQSPTVSGQTVSYYDPYGRTIRTATQTGTGWYVTDTCYDAVGRITFQSYPYSVSALGSQVCSGLGDSTQFDALGRIKAVLHGDTPQTSVSYTYNGAATQKVDENGKTHIYQTDFLGRPTIVCEISSVPLQSDVPTTCGTLIAGTGFVTTYANTLTSTTITQGAQTRIFTYDGLGRLTSKTEPEAPGASGGPTVTYAYSNQGTAGQMVTRTTLKANQTDPTVTTIAVTQYDLLGRVNSVTYNDGITPNKTYTYDTAPSGSNFNAGYAAGMMTAATASNGASTFYSYDALGRIQGTSQCVPGWCGTGTPAAFTRSYGYDWEGDPTTEQYSTPSGTVELAYGVNLAGQLVSVTGGQDASVSSLFSANTLTPYGPTASSLGNGLNQVMSYDPFGRLSGLGLQKAGAPVYAYTANWLGQQVTGSNDSVNGSGTYSYDDFNRLQSSTINTAAGTLNIGWFYDRYGNRLSQSTSGAYPVSVVQPSFSVSTANNHITNGGYTYDAAGNLMSDGTNTYTYDAEGNLMAVTGANNSNSVYDALNQRVLTSVNGTVTAYGFNANGQRATTWDSNGNLLSAQYYASSQPLAYWLASDGHVRFEHQDWLGTERVRTSYTGTVEGSFTSLPFGDSTSTASGTDNNSYHFAGLELETIDIQHAVYRDYSTTQGRWLRTDPDDDSYDGSDPQTFNRYSYAVNTPLVATDTSGLDHYEYDFRNGCIESTYVTTDVAGFTVTAYGNSAGSFCSGGGDGVGGGGSYAGAVGGGGGGRTFAAVQSRGPYRTPQQCQALANKINEYLYQIAKRQAALNTNPYNLPQFAPGPRSASVNGHQEELGDYIQRLANAAHEYNNGCGGGPPAASTTKAPAPSMPPIRVPPIMPVVPMTEGGITLGEILEWLAGAVLAF